RSSVACPPHPLSLLPPFSLYAYAPPRPLHSFPTRRSSDLPVVGRRRLPLLLPPPPVGRPQHAGGTAGSPRSHQGLARRRHRRPRDRKSTRLNSSHRTISYAVFCLKKKKKKRQNIQHNSIRD